MQYAALAVAWLLALVRVVAGQIGYNAETNSLMCSKPGGTYCDGVSLTTPILINCASANVAEVHSCDLVLAHILPDGFQEAALCYETSESAGDAVCAFNGTGYTLDGISYEIPESSIIALRDANESATPETDSTDACGIFAIPPETTDTVGTAVTSAGSSEYTGSQSVSSSSAKSSLSPSPSFTNVSLTDTVITTSLPYTVKSNPKAATTHIFTTEEGSVPALTTVWKTIVLFKETEAVESSTGVLHQQINTTISPPEASSSSIIVSNIHEADPSSSSSSSSSSWVLVTIQVIPTPSTPSYSSFRPSPTTTNAARPRESGANEARAAFIVLLVFAAALL